LSRSEAIDSAGDFRDWLTRAFAKSGCFTALVVLVEIAGTRVTPLCSTFFHVIGNEIEWSDIVDMFHGSGRQWDGAAFFPTTSADGGPLDNAFARMKLRDLEGRLDHDRLVLNEGHFFDKWGRRMKIEEVTTQ